MEQPGRDRLGERVPSNEVPRTSSLVDDKEKEGVTVRIRRVRFMFWKSSSSVSSSVSKQFNGLQQKIGTWRCDCFLQNDKIVHEDVWINQYVA